MFDGRDRRLRGADYRGLLGAGGLAGDAVRRGHLRPDGRADLGRGQRQRVRCRSGDVHAAVPARVAAPPLEGVADRLCTAPGTGGRRQGRVLDRLPCDRRQRCVRGRDRRLRAADAVFLLQPVGDVLTVARAHRAVVEEDLRDERVAVEVAVLGAGAQGTDGQAAHVCRTRVSGRGKRAVLPHRRARALERSAPDLVVGERVVRRDFDVDVGVHLGVRERSQTEELAIRRVAGVPQVGLVARRVRLEGLVDDEEGVGLRDREGAVVRLHQRVGAVELERRASVDGAATHDRRLPGGEGGEVAAEAASVGPRRHSGAVGVRERIGVEPQLQAGGHRRGRASARSLRDHCGCLRACTLAAHGVGRRHHRADSEADVRAAEGQRRGRCAGDVRARCAVRVAVLPLEGVADRLRSAPGTGSRRQGRVLPGKPRHRRRCSVRRRGRRRRAAEPVFLVQPTGDGLAVGGAHRAVVKEDLRDLDVGEVVAELAAGAQPSD